MGYVQTDFATVGTKIFADIRGKRMEARITTLPFINLNFKRSN